MSKVLQIALGNHVIAHIDIAAWLTTQGLAQAAVGAVEAAPGHAQPWTHEEVLLSMSSEELRDELARRGAFVAMPGAHAWVADSWKPVDGMSLETIGRRENLRDDERLEIRTNAGVIEYRRMTPSKVGG